MKLSKLVLSLLGSLLIANAYAAPATLAERWSTLRAEQPKLQIRDAARALGVSEAQLLATNIGNGVTRLQADGNQPREIMRAALDLGLVQAITRNENGVIETTGTASKFKQAGDKSEQADAKDPETEARQRNIAGGYLGGAIDLRFHFDTNCGVCHQVMPEAGVIYPGMIVVATDSHTTTHRCCLSELVHHIKKPLTFAVIAIGNARPVKQFTTAIPHLLVLLVCQVFVSGCGGAHRPHSGRLRFSTQRDAVNA